MTEGNGTAKPGITIWQIVILFLSIYVLGAMFVETIVALPPETSALLTLIDNLICLVFIGDFFYNLLTAKSKADYLKWGWIDLVSSIPNIQVLRWGRFVRVIRILRILRGIRSTKTIIRFLFANRAKGIFASVIMISFVLVVFSSIAILNCETPPEANIKTAKDAIWWSASTITTVGSDCYPVTTLGRIIAVILMIAGVGIAGTFTAYIATVFLQQGQKEEEGREEKMLTELRDIQQRLDRMEKKTDSGQGNE